MGWGWVLVEGDAVICVETVVSCGNRICVDELVGLVASC